MTWRKGSSFPVLIRSARAFDTTSMAWFSRSNCSRVACSDSQARERSASALRRSVTSLKAVRRPVGCPASSKTGSLVATTCNRPAFWVENDSSLMTRDLAWAARRRWLQNWVESGICTKERKGSPTSCRRSFPNRLAAVRFSS